MPTGADAERRQTLVDAAEAVMTERGIQSSTIEEITVRAGTAKGTFYLYFTSKDEVIQAVQQRHYRTMVQRAGETVARLGGGDWWRTVDAFVAMVVDYDIEHRAWFRQVARGWTPTAAEQAERRILLTLIEQALLSGMRQGVCEVEDLELSAVALLSAIDGAAHHFLMGEEEVDRDRLVQGFQSLVRRVLRPLG